MNWLGAGLRGFIGSVLGCIGGALAFLYLRRRGIDLPPLVGVVAGIATLLASRDKSGTRGLVVGAMAVWACAIAEVSASPVHGLVSDLYHFSDRLEWLNRISYVACALCAVALGGRALPRHEPPLSTRSTL
jgi:hypothetical protein